MSKLLFWDTTTTCNLRTIKFVFLGILKSRSQGPGALQFHGGKCIHVYGGGLNDGQLLVIYRVCDEKRLAFELRSDGILMHTKYNMCVKPIGPVIEGVKVSLYHFRKKKNRKTQHKVPLKRSSRIGCRETWFDGYGIAFCLIQALPKYHKCFQRSVEKQGFFSFFYYIFKLD